MAEPQLERGLGLAEATALNMIDMVGIGPFVVVPLVIEAMPGPQCLLAWAVGALVALMDGCVWAELGAAMPEAGGSYVFLREAFGPGRWGGLMAFLFIWQTMFQAPLVMASAAIGFSQYATYLVPLGWWGQKALSGGVVIAVVALLYRRIEQIGKITMFLWAGVILTLAWLIWGGLTHFDSRLAFTFPPGAWNLSWPFFAGLGAATVQTIYTYLGYYNVCNLGSEIRSPQRNIPRSIFLSVLGIAALYLVFQTSILGVIPWQQARTTPFIASALVERIYGAGAARIATGMVLWVAFGSLFALTLGYSRVPYAAAVDGTFFRAFARVHPTRRFPHVSLLALGGVALVFSLLFRLREVIAAILAMRILVQFVGGAVGVMILRRKWGRERLPFRMWLFPAPAVAAILLWIGVFVSTGRTALAGLGVMAAGAVVFLARAAMAQQWPFAEAAR
ncbi:MAG TPA: APC family permease [Candidatus Acidoferrales bacterium]|nr:APC family permease [Candidatus Acidoferrales bacterium]